MKITVGYRHWKTGAGSIDFETEEEFDNWFTVDNKEFKVIGIIHHEKIN